MVIFHCKLFVHQRVTTKFHHGHAFAGGFQIQRFEPAEAVCDGVATRAEGRGGAEADLPSGHRAAQRPWEQSDFEKRRVGRKTASLKQHKFMSENGVITPKPNGFADHYPYEKWIKLAISLGIYTLFSDKPT